MCLALRFCTMKTNNRVIGLGAGCVDSVYYIKLLQGHCIDTDGHIELKVTL